MGNRLSIVIPVKDRAELVQRTLESVRRQSAPGFDVILVDNGSTDNTPEILHLWQHANDSEARPVKVLTCATPGATAARNAGLEAVTTPWVLFFDSDDEMHTGHIARVLEGIERYPQAQVLGWNTYHKGRGVKPFKVRNVQWYNLFEGSFATQRWAARTDLIRQVGGWDTEVRLWDDIELGSRILAAEPEMRHLGPEVTVTVYPQEASISANKSGDYIDRIEAPLTRIAATLPEKYRIWTQYVRMIVAGNTVRQAGADPNVRAKALALKDKVLQSAPGKHRLLLKAVYHFRRLGGRGQNHLLRLILC